QAKNSDEKKPELPDSEDSYDSLYRHTNHCEFKDTFEKTKAYPYKPSSLNLLIEKISLFLLDYFQKVFNNHEKSKPINKSRKKKTSQYELFILGETVDPRCLPIGYSTNMPPSSDTLIFMNHHVDNHFLIEPYCKIHINYCVMIITKYRLSLCCTS
ncbi:9656_t:CDS:2, partial [Funneliformis geosporum]